MTTRLRGTQQPGLPVQVAAHPCGLDVKGAAVKGADWITPGSMD